MNNSGDKWTWSKVFSLMQNEALGESWSCRLVVFESDEDVLLEATNERFETHLQRRRGLIVKRQSTSSSHPNQHSERCK